MNDTLFAAPLPLIAYRIKYVVFRPVTLRLQFSFGFAFNK